MVSEVGFPAPGGSGALLELSDIRLVSEAWPRAEVDLDRAAEFYALYEADGETALPPVEVISDPSGGFVLADGWHRLTALSALGVDRVRAVVLPVPAGRDPETAAFERAMASSAFSSKPLSRAEKQAAVLRLIELHPRASDREIGRLAGVDHKTVGRLRARGISPPPEGTRARSAPGPELAARKLLEAFDRIREARGLGLVDWCLGGDRTGHRLADALLDVYGEDAVTRARLCIDWLGQAIEVLEQGQVASMSRRRDYKAEYRRRQQLARARGFSGYAQQRRFSPRLRRARDLGRLPETARAARSDALHVIAIARERGISIEEAARGEHVPVHVVRWWGGDALTATRRGRTLAQKGDRLFAAVSDHP